MAKVFGKCPFCGEVIPVNDEKDTGFCGKCGKQISVQQSIQILQELGGEPARTSAAQTQETPRIRTKAIDPGKQIQDMFQLCGSEDDFLNLREQILAMDISDHEKASLLEALDVATRQRLSNVLEKAQAYEEAQASPRSTITGAICLVIIGALCSYFFSVRWLIIVGAAIAVLGVISNFAERSNSSKNKENEQAAALIAAYRQKGYKL